MSAKHTPGEWMIVSEYAGSHNLKIINDQGLPICEGLGWSNDQEANARLIASAPEMLKAIEYQIDLKQWIESADCESPFFEETLRLRLNTASDLIISAMEKAKGLKHE